MLSLSKDISTVYRILVGQQLLPSLFQKNVSLFSFGLQGLWQGVFCNLTFVSLYTTYIIFLQFLSRSYLYLWFLNIWLWCILMCHYLFLFCLRYFEHLWFLVCCFSLILSIINYWHTNLSPTQFSCSLPSHFGTKITYVICFLFPHSSWMISSVFWGFFFSCFFFFFFVSQLGWFLLT